MNRAQHIVYRASLLNSKIIILKSRQQGISTFWLVNFFDDVIFNPNLTVGLLAQGQEEAAGLLKKTKILWNCLDPALKTHYGLEITTDNQREIAFSNYSNIFIRESFRSTTLHRLHISELAKIANRGGGKAREVITGTLQAAGNRPVIIESTAEGENLFKTIWDGALDRDVGKTMIYHRLFLSWLNDPDCYEEDPLNIIESTPYTQKYFNQLERKEGLKLSRGQKNFWISKYRELGPDVFQEYPASPEEAFHSTVDATYYRQLYHEYMVEGSNLLENDLEKVIEDTTVPWILSPHLDPKLPVHAALDLGINDDTVILFFQLHGRKIHIIGEHSENGKGVDYYCQFILNRYKPYARFDLLILPHDAEQRSLANAAPLTHTFQLFGFNRQYICNRTEILEGIHETRRIFPNLYVDSSCTNLIAALKNYRKSWNYLNQTFSKTPTHDKYSHAADALRYLVLGTKYMRAPYEEEFNPHPRDYAYPLTYGGLAI